MIRITKSGTKPLELRCTRPSRVALQRAGKNDGSGEERATRKVTKMERSAERQNVTPPPLFASQTPSLSIQINGQNYNLPPFALRAEGSDATHHLQRNSYLRGETRGGFNQPIPAPMGRGMKKKNGNDGENNNNDYTIRHRAATGIHSVRPKNASDETGSEPRVRKGVRCVLPPADRAGHNRYAPPGNLYAGPVLRVR